MPARLPANRLGRGHGRRTAAPSPAFPRQPPVPAPRYCTTPPRHPPPAPPSWPRHPGVVTVSSPKIHDRVQTRRVQPVAAPWHTECKSQPRASAKRRFQIRSPTHPPPLPGVSGRGHRERAHCTRHWWAAGRPRWPPRTAAGGTEGGEAAAAARARRVEGQRGTGGRGSGPKAACPPGCQVDGRVGPTSKREDRRQGRGTRPTARGFCSPCPTVGCWCLAGTDGPTPAQSKTKCRWRLGRGVVPDTTHQPPWSPELLVDRQRGGSLWRGRPHLHPASCLARRLCSP